MWIFYFTHLRKLVKGATPAHARSLVSDSDRYYKKKIHLAGVALKKIHLNTLKIHLRELHLLSVFFLLF